MEFFKKPLGLLVIAAAVVAIVGATAGWFTIGSQFVRMMAEDQLAKKQTLAIVLTLASVGILLVASLVKKQRAAFGAVVVSLYSLVMIVNQKPDPEIVQKIALSVNVGYWLSIVGTLVLIVAGCIIGAKGLEYLPKRIKQ